MLNQLSTTLYPMPSRTLLINEMRELKAEVAKEQDKILDNFLRDHPEYAINDTTQTRGFYHKYVASQRLVKEELKPVLIAYENQLQKQQAWVERLKWVSPAITIQESLNKMTGTSTGDYEHFRKQVVAFAETWRDFLTPFLYNNENFTQKDYPKLPQFVFQPKPQSKPFLVPVVLLLISTLFFGIGYIASKKPRKIVY